MNYGRIRRGPMAADAHFTQISNALFRDPRISYKAKGIFGLISTHRDGFGVTPETIASCGKDGVAAVRTALQELEQYGYLERTQARRSDGTMGPTTYYITDMPRSAPHIDFRQPALTSGNAQNPSSEPHTDFPHAVEPQAVNHTHKKTSSKHTNGKKTLSPPVPGQRASEQAGQQERETTAAPHNDQALQVAAAWQATRGGRRNPAAERDITRTAAELLAADWPLADVIALAQDMAAKYPTGRDLTRHADHWQPPQAAKPQLRLLPDWCGTCNDGDDTAITQPARRFINRPDGTSIRCHCHPAAVHAA